MSRLYEERMTGRTAGLERANRRLRRELDAERKAARRLRGGEGRCRRLVETAPAGIWIVDAEQRTTYANREMAGILGLAPDRMIGRPVEDFLDEQGRSDLRARRALWRPGGREQHDVRFLRPDGKEVWGIVSVQPFFDRTGRLSGVVRAVTDITGRRRQEENLRRSRQLESVGRLAGGIAHDFNNLMTVVTGYAQLILSRIDPGSPLRNEIGQILHAGERAAALTRQLLAFGRQQAMEPRTIDLNVLVASLAPLLRRLLGNDIELVTELATGPETVRADPEQVVQAVFALAVNARDAMPRGGRLIIGTSDAAVGEDDAEGDPDVRPGRYATLSIRDTGQGMSEEVKTHLFEPFFTTKETGKGAGPGLAAVYGIVSQSGGHIRVESEPGRGSTFRIALPRWQDLRVKPRADRRRTAPGREAPQEQKAG